MSEPVTRLTNAEAEHELRESIRRLLDAFEWATEAEVATLPVITQELAARGIELPPWLAMI